MELIGRITDMLTYDSHSCIRKEKSKRLLEAIKRLTSCSSLFNKPMRIRSEASLPLPSRNHPYSS